MITIVSGLPRSGTSLTMQMLKAGGFPLVWNREPNVNEYNPKGYYEWEQPFEKWQAVGEKSREFYQPLDGKRGRKRGRRKLDYRPERGVNAPYL